MSILEAARSRAALDFGGSLSPEGLRLLANVSKSSVSTAISEGELRLDPDGCIPAEEAQNWLARRRDFCPSRWRNLQDDQWPFDPRSVTEEDKKGQIWVPQSGEGDLFIPELVVRPRRRGPGISITVGEKGSEVQHHDFFDALRALASMSVPHWRRRNRAGNWGIVRARGPWVAISKAEIERQVSERIADATGT